jgi:4-hydroxy-3-methylbut-2-enyl diphosphate reductase IspH
METIIINTKNSSNAKFILELAKKLGESGKVLSQSDQEDFLFGTLMKNEKTGIKVSREAIFKKLEK